MKKLLLTFFLFALVFSVDAQLSSYTITGDTVRIKTPPVRSGNSSVFELYGKMYVHAVPIGLTANSMLVYDTVSRQVKRMTLNYTSWDSAYRMSLRLFDTAALHRIEINSKQPAGSYAVTTNNLSDLSSASAARTNLGLGNLDNTSDANKPVSSAQAAAIALKVDKTTTVNGYALSSNVTVTKSDVGLGNVDNTSDANKPVSTAQSAALAAKLDLAGGTMTGALTLNADPTNAFHPATKNYVDNLVTGLSWKQAVKAATTANITLSGAQTIDGVSIVAGDRVLVKNQSTGANNGIYIAASGSWTRAADADAAAELLGATVYIDAGGTANGGTQWSNNNTSITLGSTAVSFIQIAGAGVYTNGPGINLTGNAFSIDNTVVTLTGTQTLSNKTIGGTTITGTLSFTNVGGGLLLNSSAGTGSPSSLNLVTDFYTSGAPYNIGHIGFRKNSTNTFAYLVGNSLGSISIITSTDATNYFEKVKFSNSGDVTLSGSATASSFSGAGTGLTGTASGLSIGGNAATATNSTQWDSYTKDFSSPISSGVSSLLVSNGTSVIKLANNTALKSWAGYYISGDNPTFGNVTLNANSSTKYMNSANSNFSTINNSSTNASANLNILDGSGTGVHLNGSGAVSTDGTLIINAGSSSEVSIASAGSNYVQFKDKNSFPRIWFETTGSNRTLFDIPTSASIQFRDHSGNILTSFSENGTATFGSSVTAAFYKVDATTFGGMEYYRGGTLLGYVGTENASTGMRYNSTTGTYVHNFYANGTLAASIGASGVSVAGSVTSAGNVYAFSTKSSNYTLTGNDHYIKVTSSATITLPTAVGRAGQKYVLTVVGTAVMTLQTTSSQHVYGVYGDLGTSFTMTNALSNYQNTIVLFSDGSDWYTESQVSLCNGC